MKSLETIFLAQVMNGMNYEPVFWDKKKLCSNLVSTQKLANLFKLCNQ
jgi:hypothetical protein